MAPTQGPFTLMLKSVKKVWFRLIKVLELTNTYLLLSLVYFLTIIPLSIILRIAGKTITANTDYETYWIERPPDSSPERPF